MGGLSLSAGATPREQKVTNVYDQAISGQSGGVPGTQGHRDHSRGKAGVPTPRAALHHPGRQRAVAIRQLQQDGARTCVASPGLPSRRDATPDHVVLDGTKSTTARFV